MRRPAVLAAGSITIALTAVACGGGGGQSGAGPSAGGGSSATTQPVTRQTGAATVGVANSKYGKVLVDAQGLSLYLFEADKGSSSTCYKTCAQLWPPLTTDGAPKVTDGAKGSFLGTTERRDGTTQVTYQGHPLYYYAPDNAPGDFRGQDIDQFGAEWYLVTPSGEAAED
ncbi:MAG: COG4315 family predicted lipoprotein [Streptosporangiaceae bacterium]